MGACCTSVQRCVYCNVLVQCAVATQREQGVVACNLIPVNVYWNEVGEGGEREGESCQVYKCPVLQVVEFASLDGREAEFYKHLFQCLLLESSEVTCRWVWLQHQCVW